MSALYDFRQELKAAIVAADIGFTDDSIIIRRQTDVWNDVATSIQASKNGVALHIGVARGTSDDEDDLQMEVTVPITTVCLPEVVEGATPEEDLWEALVKFLHDYRFQANSHYSYRLRHRSFEDLEIEADGGTAYLGRQSTFAKRLIL